MEASAYLLGKQLMDGSDCNTCHQLDVKSVGPTYQNIAAKYKSDTKAEGYLASNIINGGGGVWGATVMAAHPQLSDSEARQMSKYILSLSGEAASLANRLGPKGTYPLNKHQAGTTEGKYILTASYTDKGGETIGPLTAREVVVLESPNKLASSYQEIVKAQKFRVTPEMAQGLVEEEFDLIIGTNEGYLQYAAIDFTGVKALKFSLTKAGTYFSGGKLTVHLDDVNSPPLAEVLVETSLVDFGMDELATNIPNTKGVHDLYIKFSNDGEKPVTALIAIYFSDTPLKVKS